MSYWLREVAGWALVLLGLYVFYLCYLFLRDARLIETGSLVVIGIFVFRGGIQLLKVAVAARICREAQEQLAPPRPARPAPSPAAPRRR
jgi:hypothetical protein